MIVAELMTAEIVSVSRSREKAYCLTKKKLTEKLNLRFIVRKRKCRDYGARSFPVSHP